MTTPDPLIGPFKLQVLLYLQTLLSPTISEELCSTGCDFTERNSEAQAVTAQSSPREEQESGPRETSVTP